MKKLWPLLLPLAALVLLGWVWVVAREMYREATPRVPERIANRFVEQVNTNTCDEPSGFDPDPTMWADACRAAVADLAAGTTLSTPERGSDTSSITVESHYMSVNGFPADLTFLFTSDSLLTESNPVLYHVGSWSSTFIGQSFTFNVQDSSVRESASVPGEAEAQALTERVQTLLVDGRCADVTALMAPLGVLETAVPTASPGGGNVDDCDSMAKMVATGSQSDGWAPFEYEVKDWTCISCGSAADPSTGSVPPGSSVPAEFTRRTVTGARTVRDDSEPLIQGPGLKISVVDYEDQWYVFSVSVTRSNFGFFF